MSQSSFIFVTRAEARAVTNLADFATHIIFPLFFSYLYLLSIQKLLSNFLPPEDKILFDIDGEDSNEGRNIISIQSISKKLVKG